MARVARGSPFLSALLIFLLLWSSSSSAVIALQLEEALCPVPLVTRENRKTIASTDSGRITAVDIDDGYRGPYHLQFFTLEPQSLLLPVLLHADMVFYVHTGMGTVSWVDEDETYDLEVESGDIYRIGSGSVIYMRSHPDPMREKLRVYAIFITFGTEEAFTGAYSNLSDLVRGFDEEVLRMGFRVPKEVISGLKRVEKPPPIVPFAPKTDMDGPTWKEGIFEALIGGGRPFGPNKDNGKKKKKMKTRAFNIIKAEPDVENCNGQSIAVTDKDAHALKGSDVGVFMVNLTRGSMMGPHWNPLATEIAIVTHGQGMVQVVLPTTGSSKEGAPELSMRYKVSEGDVFLVPRYHPMAQMSFNDDYLAFVGFSTRATKNHPQFLAGKSSVLQTLDREILALSLGVSNTTVGQLLAQQEDSIMLECTSCAEEEEKKMETEIEKQKEEEEEREKEEEEARRKEEEREEEEARRREEEKARREEEEARRREEEEAKKREEEEEARRREEEAKEREEEERRREEEAKEREEEERRRQQEEEARRQEEEIQREEEARRQEEEEKRRQEEEEAAQRQEEERQRQEEQERARREEEEEAQRQAEEKEARRREEEETEEEGGAGGGGGREMVWIV